MEFYEVIFWGVVIVGGVGRFWWEVDFDEILDILNLLIRLREQGVGAQREERGN